MPPARPPRQGAGVAERKIVIRETTVGRVIGSLKIPLQFRCRLPCNSAAVPLLGATGNLRT